MGCEQSAPIVDRDNPQKENGTCCAVHPKPEFSYSKGTCALEYWEPLRLIGEGSISSIHLVRRRSERIDVPYKERADIMRMAESESNAIDDEKDVYALKSIMKDHVRNDRFLEEMRSEIYTMSRLCHPNVVNVIEAYERKRHIYLILEYCRGGDLNERKFSEPEAAVIVRKVLSAVAYLHEHNVVHRDLKMENILFDKDPKDPDAEIKIIDFGLATKFLSNEYKQMTARVGTLYAIAPQVLQGVYDAKCDIWSIGVITYCLLSGKLPFWGPPQEMSWEKRKKIVVDRIMRCEYMKMKGPSWKNISPEAKRFVEQMLQMNPSRRPTAKKALQDPWIMKYQDYQPKNGMPTQGQQYAKKLQIKRKVQILIAEELKEDEIVQLKSNLMEHDPNDEDRIALKQLRNSLLQANILSDKVETIFEEEDLDMNEYTSYIDMLKDALDRKERKQEELIQDIFSHCESDTCSISKDRLRDELGKRNVAKTTLDAIFDAVDLSGDGTSVSCQQVINYLKEQEMHRMDLVCSCRESKTSKEPDDADGLVDETNAVIPGGRRESNVQPMFIYDDCSKSLRKYRPGDDEVAESAINSA